MTQPQDDLIDDAAGGGSQQPSIPLVLWRRKPLVVLGTLVGVVLGGLYFLQKPPVFESTAQLLVVKKRTDPLPFSGADSRVAMVEDYVATQVTLIRSEVILAMAARNLAAGKVNDLATGRPLALDEPVEPEVLAEVLPFGLGVARDKEATPGTASNIMNLSYRGGSQKDCYKILTAVIGAYTDFLRGTSDVQVGENLQSIEKATAQTKGEIEALKAKYFEARGRARTASPVALTDLKTRIAQNENKRTELSLKRIELVTRQNILKTGLNRNQNRSTLLTIFEATAPGRKFEGPNRTPEDVLFNLQIQEEELKQTLGKDHPQMIALQTRKRLLREYMAKAGSSGDGDKPQGDGLDIHMQVIDLELDQNKIEQDYLENELIKDRAMAQKLDETLVEEKQIDDRLEGLRKQLDNLQDRERQIRLTRDAPPYDARPITPPVEKKTMQVAPKLMQSLLIGAVLGFVCGGGLAYLAEVTDKSFRTPEEIRRRLGVPVVGHIPSLPVEEGEPAAGVAPTLVAHLRPRSGGAEAYRGVRTALYFSQVGKEGRAIQVTSPNPGDGKSTLASNLAASIAQSGKSVVIIDCDFRKPRVHQIFNVSDQIGLASVVAGEAELMATVQRCEVPGLAVLPCGPRPHNPAELLTSPRFQELVEELKREFEYVIVDTPPILAVSDPCVVAPRVDGVLMTFRIDKKSGPAAVRSREMLANLGAKLLGVVINDGDEGDGGSSPYRYGYGYGYGYGYSENYTDDDAKQPAPKG